MGSDPDNCEPERHPDSERTLMVGQRNFGHQSATGTARAFVRFEPEGLPSESDAPWNHVSRALLRLLVYRQDYSGRLDRNYATGSHWLAPARIGAYRIPEELKWTETVTCTDPGDGDDLWHDAAPTWKSWVDWWHWNATTPPSYPDGLWSPLPTGRIRPVFWRGW